MSTTISAAFVSVLAVILPWFGVDIGTEELTTTIQTIIVIASSIWIWKERKARGDVNAVGIRK